jgi:hypothetical protein
VSDTLEAVAAYEEIRHSQGTQIRLCAFFEEPLRLIPKASGSVSVKRIYGIPEPRKPAEYQ